MKFWEDVSNRIFVFGSNQEGVHGGGAAKFARESFGAVMGVGEGLTGKSYALPTKITVRESMEVSAVEAAVSRFLEYAVQNPQLTFQVTAVGCGLAGFTHEQIAPMFEQAPANCLLPGIWYRMFDPLNYPARVIVAGSRGINDSTEVFGHLDRILVNLKEKNLEIVTGLASGPDTLGKEWADKEAVQVAQFPADWDRFGKRAGFIRNQDMSWYGTHLIAFWDGKSSGTKNMIETATRDGLTVKVITIQEEK